MTTKYKLLLPNINSDWSYYCIVIQDPKYFNSGFREDNL